MAKARRARPLGRAKDHGPAAAERITSVELADILTSPRHVRVGRLALLNLAYFDVEFSVALVIGSSTGIRSRARSLSIWQLEFKTRPPAREPSLQRSSCLLANREPLHLRPLL